MNEHIRHKRLKMMSAKIDSLRIGAKKPDYVDFNTLLRIKSGQVSLITAYSSSMIHC